MCDEQTKECSTCRHCPERFMREAPVPRYDTDGALLLTHDEIRRLAVSNGIGPDSDLVEEAIDAAIEGWDAVVDLMDTFERVSGHYRNPDDVRGFLGMLSYMTDGPTFDGREIRVEPRGNAVGA